MLVRDRDLVADDDLVTRARLVLDGAWIATAFRATRTWRSPRGRPRAARQLDDVAVMSSALDASTAVAWSEGGSTRAVAGRGSTKASSRRPAAASSWPERSGSLHMMIGAGGPGDYREAAKYARARDLNSVGVPARGGGAAPALPPGNWAAHRHGPRGVGGADRPTAAPPLCPGAGAVTRLSR
jgi:hypothetical protein